MFEQEGSQEHLLLGSLNALLQGKIHPATVVQEGLGKRQYKYFGIDSPPFGKERRSLQEARDVVGRTGSFT